MKSASRKSRYAAPRAMKRVESCVNESTTHVTTSRPSATAAEARFLMSAFGYGETNAFGWRIRTGRYTMPNTADSAQAYMKTVLDVMAGGLDQTSRAAARSTSVSSERTDRQPHSRTDEIAAPRTSRNQSRASHRGSGCND